MNQYLTIEKTLEKSIRSNKPIVGLELNSISKIISYPESLALINELENIIRDLGCFPATLGIIQGQLIAGLSSEQMTHILSQESIPKISTRDIAYFITRKLTGTPTTATAMVIAKLAGIRVLSTGAIGGVHRGALENFDISADLQELSTTNVAIVCSGVNYIFDIPLTLEHLKTHGVPVIGYTTDIFPAFYVLDENLKTQYRMDDPTEIAALADAKWNLGQKGGMIVANPVPKECRIDRETMEEYIRRSISSAKEQGISRSDFTAYMIESIDSYTQGMTSKFMVDILKNNARLSCYISKGLSKLYVE